MEVTVSKVRLRDVSPVDVARMVGSSFGYHTDLEPMEPGRFKLTATNGSTTLRYNGASHREVCERFVNELIGVKDT